MVMLAELQSTYLKCILLIQKTYIFIEMPRQAPILKNENLSFRQNVGLNFDEYFSCAVD